MLDPLVQQWDFVARGGPVLVAIFCLSLWTWVLLVQRFLWLRRPASRLCGPSRIRFDLLHALVAVLPLVGLLGTVTGMIETFSIMQHTGVATPQQLSGGISRALITTLAGLFVSLCAMPCVAALERRFQELSGRAEWARVKRLNPRWLAPGRALSRTLRLRHLLTEARAQWDEP